MQAQCLVRRVERGIEADLVQRRRAAQVFLLQFGGVVVQRAIGLHGMAAGIAARQVVAQAAGGGEFAHLVEHFGGIAAQEAHRVLAGGAPGFSHCSPA
ncbi:hypothetical protein D9M70_620650 [compost metagenome]